MLSQRMRAAVAVALCLCLGVHAMAQENAKPKRPVVISTWQHGLAANAAAWKVLSKGGRALDAVEAGVRESESDPKVSSVGLGGLPDASGTVTLDACIMDEKGDCGSVACLRDIENPISVARMVMEKTPHVMLVGEGAKRFALENGMKEKELLTPRAKKEWDKWKADHPDAIKHWEINVENHDTIGMVAIDANGNLSGACTTSGLAWKLPGRVGDSPIIGAGLYVDNEVGAASATGVGRSGDPCGRLFLGGRVDAARELARGRMPTRRRTCHLEEPRLA